MVPVHGNRLARGVQLDTSRGLSRVLHYADVALVWSPRDFDCGADEVSVAGYPAATPSLSGRAPKTSITSKEK